MCVCGGCRETGPRCPVDNTKVSNHQLFKDNFAKREVLSLNVQCSALEEGCVWHGELRDLEVRERDAGSVENNICLFFIVFVSGEGFCFVSCFIFGFVCSFKHHGVT